MDGMRTGPLPSAPGLNMPVRGAKIRKEKKNQWGLNSTVLLSVYQLYLYSS